MGRTTGVLLAVALMLFPTAGALSQDAQTDLKTELQRLQDRMDRAMVDGTVEEVAAFYAEDAVVLPNNAPKIVGRAAIKKMMQEQRKAGVSLGSFTGTVDDAWECGGMVYSVGTYAMSADIPGRPRPVGDKGKSFAVFRRTDDGTLEIVYDMWNTDIEYGK